MKLKLISWNINGIRAILKKGFHDSVFKLEPDIICLQEIKADSEVMNKIDLGLSEYNLHYHSSQKKGYSGVATLSKAMSRKNQEASLFSNIQAGKDNLQLIDFQEGIGLSEFDYEGRFVLTRYLIKDRKINFTLINCYYPQGGRGRFRIDFKLGFYNNLIKVVHHLKSKGEKIILCGDFNTTFTDLDLARPKTNKNNTGCLPEEREVLKNLLDCGFIDSFRHFFPEKAESYTYWDQITRARERNVGWRIDLFLVDEKLIKYLKAATIHDQIYGSDHCPISVDLEFKDN
jgi:exodeoxyribonuclease III